MTMLLKTRAVWPFAQELAPLCERNLDFADPRAFHFEVPDAGRQLIFELDDFISAEEATTLTALYDAHVGLCENQASNALSAPIFYCSPLLQHPALKNDWRFLQAIKLRVLDEAKERFGLRELYFEHEIINQLTEGHRHAEHSDNSDYVCRAHGDHRWEEGDCHEGRWVPMSDRWMRDVSAVLYLNDAYEGGELYFSQYGITHRPKPRQLMLFPSNRYFLHRVRPVTRGVRYAMPMWFTRDWHQMGTP